MMFKNENSFEEWKLYKDKRFINFLSLLFKNENSFEEWKLKLKLAWAFPPFFFMKFIC